MFLLLGAAARGGHVGSDELAQRADREFGGDSRVILGLMMCFDLGGRSTRPPTRLRPPAERSRSGIASDHGRSHGGGYGSAAGDGTGHFAPTGLFQCT